ncbi:hypothetical protein CQJ28_24425 [Escherichia sp. E2562]|uniref:DUF4087 domain-containing protein n=1 Tax=unclassified Escherichia TaxID=2608889 RepID=UPI00102A67EE|nr:MULTISPECIES: DUF4087 domain-containing protein [unclassified Escherichia]RZM96348.1 DUF4087 domain-containing protein [Escherichia sp. E14V5]RZM99593.1 DUF4087 domain-containing protein [Escherichia sp. E14V7]RZN23243.1 DUF4087 domain-containing protein [Escherichia sp. E14V10]TGB52643.1 hypothetical protein CRT22_24540 [Escherichia sp. E5028]TGC12698.1 hypothetical protein CQJ28_24425 [Escherichia sp. E2562]
MKPLFITVFLFVLSFFCLGSELRCGWLQNPSPSNQWISDKDGTWDISIQGRFTSSGIEKLKGFPDKEFVKTNENYGYGCACISADVDHDEKKVIKIYSSKILPLSRCQGDRTLSEP